MKRLNDRELTPALLRQAAHLMTKHADVIDEGMLDRRALDRILLQAAEHRQSEMSKQGGCPRSPMVCWRLYRGRGPVPKICRRVRCWDATGAPSERGYAPAHDTPKRGNR